MANWTVFTTLIANRLHMPRVLERSKGAQEGKNAKATGVIGILFVNGVNLLGHAA